MVYLNEIFLMNFFYVQHEPGPDIICPIIILRFGSLNFSGFRLLVEGL